MKALVGAFNQEKALVVASSVIVKTHESFAALALVSNSAEARDSGDTAEWRKQLETSPVSGGYQLFVS